MSKKLTSMSNHALARFLFPVSELVKHETRSRVRFELDKELLLNAQGCHFRHDSPGKRSDLSLCKEGDLTYLFFSPNSDSSDDSATLTRKCFCFALMSATREHLPESGTIG